MNYGKATLLSALPVVGSLLSLFCNLCRLNVSPEHIDSILHEKQQELNRLRKKTATTLEGVAVRKKNYFIYCAVTDNNRYFYSERRSGDC